MKNKFKIFCIVLLSIILALTVVFATDDKQIDIISKDETINVENGYEKKELVQNARKSENIKYFLNEINVSHNNFENIKSYEVKDNINDLELIEYSNDDFILSVNKKTNELRSYINNKTSFPKCNLSKNEVESKAIELFSTFKIKDKKDYILNYVTKFDDEIWRANFVKSYDGLKNPGEAINIAFAPTTNEIITLAIIKNEYNNNEIKISEEDALKIAQKYINKSVTPKVKEVKIDIIKPNQMFKKVVENKMYKHINKMRKSYVIILENDSKIYVDVTTGEILGGDCILGGEF